MRTRLDDWRTGYGSWKNWLEHELKESKYSRDANSI